MKQSSGKVVLLTVEEAATRLHVKSSTVRSWILRRQHLEVVKVGRLVRITERSVDDFIDRSTTPPRED
jgi:excisionase family DNA binding protein